LLVPMGKKMLGVIEIINEYGFPIVAVVGMGWFIWFIYNYITNLIAEKLDQANVVLIALIDRIRMLDNDIIRLKSKINTVIELQELQKKQDEKKDEKTK